MPFGTIISVEVVRDSTGAPQVRCRGACGGSPLAAPYVQAARLSCLCWVPEVAGSRHALHFGLLVLSTAAMC